MRVRVYVHLRGNRGTGDCVCEVAGDGKKQTVNRQKN